MNGGSVPTPSADGSDLEGRVARCAYYGTEGRIMGRPTGAGLCNAERPSATTLPFFEHLPDRERDRFYCGCMGWD